MLSARRVDVLAFGHFLCPQATSLTLAALMDTPEHILVGKGSGLRVTLVDRGFFWLDSEVRIEKTRATS